MPDTNVDILAPDRFEELDAKLAEIDAALDDPDSVSGTPQAFFDWLEKAFQDAADIARQLTPQDFEETYEESENEENDEEENSSDGLGGLGL